MGWRPLQAPAPFMGLRDAMLRRIKLFLGDNSGVAMLEYVLLAALLIATILLSVKASGTRLNAKFLNIGNSM